MSGAENRNRPASVRHEVLKALSIGEDSFFPGDRLDPKALAALPPGRLETLTRGGWLRAATGGTS